MLPWNTAFEELCHEIAKEKDIVKAHRLRGVPLERAFGGKPSTQRVVDRYVLILSAIRISAMMGIASQKKRCQRKKR